MVKDEAYKLSRGIKELLINHFEQARKIENFGNGRYCRNLLDKVKFAQSDRVVTENATDINQIKICDIKRAIEQIEMQSIRTEKSKIGFATRKEGEVVEI